MPSYENVSHRIFNVFHCNISITWFSMFYQFLIVPFLAEIKISSFYPCLAAWKWMVFDNDFI